MEMESGLLEQIILIRSARADKHGISCLLEQTTFHYHLLEQIILIGLLEQIACFQKYLLEQIVSNSNICSISAIFSVDIHLAIFQHYYE